MTCAAISGLQQVQGADRFDGMDAYVREGMARWKVPGLAMAVVHNGEVVLARGFGTRQILRDMPVESETVFPIASCTKTLTASCIALFVDEGRIQWDDPVRKLLPDFKVADPYVTEHVTIRDLLCHRTGLVRGDLVGMSGVFTKGEMLNQLQFLPQAAPFRSKVTYNNLMFSVLGEIVERKSGKSWDEFVATRLFEPLGMKSTTTDCASIPRERLALRHRLYDDSVETLRTPNSDKMAPAGAVHSTVNDMARWLALQLREGDLNESPLISKNALREMHSLQQSIPVRWRPDSDEYDARFVGTGLGWYVRDYRGRKVVQHGGAWGAEMAFVPEEKLGVVVLSNRDFNGLVWMLIYDAIDAYVVGPQQAWKQGEEWERWLAIGGPDTTQRDLRQQRAILEKGRKDGTRPSRPLADYAGSYRSTLYGNLKVTVVDDHLHVRFGDYAASLEHWEQDSFYGRAVIEPHLDWLVKFDLDQAHAVGGLEIIHVGWKDPDERFLFQRSPNP